MNTEKLPTWPLLVFPLTLTLGILIIPMVPDYSDHAAAESAAGQTLRWFWGHLLCAASFGIGALTSGIVVGLMGERSNARWRTLCVPLMAAGGALYSAGLGADGIGPLAASAGGGTARMFFDGSGIWITGVFMVGAILFGVGLLLLVLIVIRSGLLSNRSRAVVFLAALVFLVAPTIPSGWALYGIAVASFGVYIPIWRVLTERSAFKG